VSDAPSPAPSAPYNFIAERIERELAEGRFGGQVITRFPPEPNGFLHIGHAFAITISSSLARKHGGRFHLRFDDTNPTKEDVRYVESQMRDVRWVGADWGEHLYYASDYFGKMVEYAFQLIRQGDAFVCHLPAEQIREMRGTFKEPGQPSPYRDRPVDADAAYRKALVEYERVAKDFPNSPNYRKYVINCWTKIGAAGVFGGDKAVGLEAYQTARRLSAELVRDFPDNKQYKASLESLDHLIRGFTPPEKK